MVYSAPLGRHALIHVQVDDPLAVGRDPTKGAANTIIEAVQRLDAAGGGVLVTGPHVTITIQPLDGKTHA